MKAIRLNKMTAAEKRTLAQFCKAVVDWRDGGKTGVSFLPCYGLCTNLRHFTSDLKLPEFNPFVEVLPFNNLDTDRRYSDEWDKFKNPRRMAFVRRWAKKAK